MSKNCRHNRIDFHSPAGRVTIPLGPGVGWVVTVVQDRCLDCGKALSPEVPWDGEIVVHGPDEDGRLTKVILKARVSELTADAERIAIDAMKETEKWRRPSGGG